MSDATLKEILLLLRKVHVLFEEAESYSYLRLEERIQRVDEVRCKLAAILAKLNLIK